MTITHARLLDFVDDEFTTADFPIERLIAGMEDRGYLFVGTNSNPAQRAELQGQPRFKGVNGPMWDGDRLRYETPAAYAALFL